MSTIPAVLDRLVTIFGTAAPDARVDDGPVSGLIEVAENGTDLGIIVGWSETGAVVEADIDLEGGVGDRRETYRVNCLLAASSGDSDTKTLRVLVFATYKTLVDQLKAEHPISLGVMRAYMDIIDYSAYPTETGMAASLRFGVFVNAFDR
jgi:hypothetical protein